MNENTQAAVEDILKLIQGLQIRADTAEAAITVERIQKEEAVRTLKAAGFAYITNDTGDMVWMPPDDTELNSSAKDYKTFSEIVNSLNTRLEETESRYKAELEARKEAIKLLQDTGWELSYNNNSGYLEWNSTSDAMNTLRNRLIAQRRRNDTLLEQRDAANEENLRLTFVLTEKGFTCSRPDNIWHLPEDVDIKKQLETEKHARERAEATLVKAGWTLAEGAELWKPPLKKAPDFAILEEIERLKHINAELEADRDYFRSFLAISKQRVTNLEKALLVCAAFDVHKDRHISFVIANVLKMSWPFTKQDLVKRAEEAGFTTSDLWGEWIQPYMFSSKETSI